MENCIENPPEMPIFVTKRAKDMDRYQEHITKVRKQLQQSVNPFSNDLLIEVSTRISADAVVIDKEGNQSPDTCEIEKEKCMKVYKSAAKRDMTMNLSSTAQRMLLFIMYEMQDADDWVEIDPLWYKEKSQAGSRNMYKKGKDELVRYGYISRTEYKNIYWVNPALLYGGNRMKKWPGNVLIKNVFKGDSIPKHNYKTNESI